MRRPCVRCSMTISRTGAAVLDGVVVIREDRLTCPASRTAAPVRDIVIEQRTQGLLMIRISARRRGRNNLKFEFHAESRL